MEDYIYILIAVIWLAASIYRASQKKKQAAAQKTAKPDAEPKSTMSEAKSLLEELLGGQEVKVPEPEEQEIEYSEPETVGIDIEPDRQIFENEYAQSSLSKLEAITKEGSRSTDRILFTDTMSQLDKKAKGQDRINLRKAIIYSAILERPYS